MATIESYETAPAGSDTKSVIGRRSEPRRRNAASLRLLRDATAFAATVEVLEEVKEDVAPAAGRVTVGERGMQWLARQTHLKPSSVRTIGVAWRVHVEPQWGCCPLS